MILITGGAGFIGSNLINSLLTKNLSEIVSVDDKNFVNQSYFINKNFSRILPVELNNFLKKNKKKIKTVVHLGAITSTTERDINLIVKNNLELSINLWNWCEYNKKRFIYASSAATYGNGSNSFDDDESNDYLSKLIPLNLYGWSKHIFDRQIFNKKKKPLQFVGLKFFNVYGPNEFHKNEMRSVILKIYEKISNNLQVNLFKSHNVKFKDGEQLRDFIYVKDVISILEWFLSNPKINGLYNVGTGKPRSFNDIAKSIFKNTNKTSNIKYINTPMKIRKQYQYYTKANIKKLRDCGYKKSFFSLEEGIKNYIRGYLKK